LGRGGPRQLARCPASAGVVQTSCSGAGAQALAKLQAVGYHAGDVYLHCAPLYHVGGLSSALAVLAAGALQARRSRAPRHSRAPVRCSRPGARLARCFALAPPVAAERPRVPAARHDPPGLQAAPTAERAAAKPAGGGPRGSAAGVAPQARAPTPARRAAQVFLPAFSARAALALIAEHRVTALIAVPAMVVDLLAAARGAGGAAPAPELGAGLGCPSVRRVLLGGGELAPRLIWRLRLLFPAAALTAAYGMTEACSSITFLPLGRPVSGDAPAAPDGGPAGAGRAWAGAVCVGLPPAGIEVAVRLLAGGEDAGGCDGGGGSGGGRPRPAPAPGGAPGEVLTRGLHTMLRYWGDARATAAALVAWPPQPGAPPGGPAAPVLAERSLPGARLAGGVGPCAAGQAQPRAGDGVGQAQAGPPQGAPGAWLCTGDLGFLDAAGRLWLAGRLKDVVRSGGESVNAAEVERALRAHAGVADAAVVGLPHARLGEQVAALLVLRPGRVFAGPYSCEDGPEAHPGGRDRPSGGPAPAAAAALSPQAAAAPAARRPQQRPARAPGGGSGAAGSAAAAGEAPLTAAGVAAFCRAQGLAGFKAPRVVAAQAAPLPANSAGKVLKAAVRGALQARLAAAGRPPPSRL